MGMAVPKEYAKVIIKAPTVTLPIIANEITEARIGPTQGVHKSPRENPIKSPPSKPALFFVWGTSLANLENVFSIKVWNRGIKKEMPKPPMIAIEIRRKDPVGILLKWTIVERKRVKKVKLAINPTTTPKGRLLLTFSSPTTEERTIGRIGRIQGERIVTTPAKKAKKVSKIIVSLFSLIVDN